ncbi:MAG: hypothetical protein J7M27_03495 [Candidatus Latescibacteria bacterium]|nr:hypothetical protein [Candidatus Latescibacterota bacterium]
MRKVIPILLSIPLILAFFSPPATGSIRYGLSFTQNDNVFTWSHSLSQLNWTVGALKVNGNSSMNSTLNRHRPGTNQPDRWRDVNNTRLSVSYSFSERIRLGINSSTSKTSDTVSKTKREVATQNFSSSVSWRPFNSLSFSQSMGQNFDQRRGQSASGLSYSTSVSVTPKLMDRLSTSLSFSQSGNRSKRKDFPISMNGSIGYRLSGERNLKLSFSERRHQQKYYASASQSDAEVALLDRFEGSRSSTLNFDLGKLFGIKASGSANYSSSEVDDEANDDPKSSKHLMDRSKQGFGWSGKLSGTLFDRLPVSGGARYSQDEVDYDKDRLDKKNEDLSVNATVGIGLTEADSLSVLGRITIHRSDTPDPDEHNDRDQLANYATVTYSRTFRSGLKLRCTLSTSQNHLVYLAGERSGNNKWTRTYTLTPGLQYRPSDKLSLSQNYSLSANYQEYDYDALLNPTAPRSYVSRMASVRNSFQWTLSRRTKLNGGYTFQMSDEGRLCEEDGQWKQAIARDRVSHSANVSLSYRAGSFLSLSPGYTYSLREDWGRKPEEGTEIRYRTGKNISEGYTLTVSYNPSSENALSLNLRRTRRKRWKRETDVRDIVSITYAHIF